VYTPDKTRGALIELRSVCNDMYAVIYRFGARIGYRKLTEGTEVWRASEADEVHIPKVAPRFMDSAKGAFGFSGWYVVPGDGVSAIFGAKPPPSLVSATLS
jgi:hypothetical protein